jgi:glycine/D-amino acid oxidase-like deaminating enzyme
MIDRRRYDPTDQTISYGLYYITQNAHTGDLFIGGECSEIDGIISSDDTCMSKTSSAKLRSVLPSIFAKGWDHPDTPEVRSMWSGIMGFTPDGVPWVGKLPSLITGREGDGEWVAAGFNGYGMPLCWGCGEAVAKQVLGMDVSDWFPESFSVSLDRLNSPRTTVEAGITGLIG